MKELKNREKLEKQLNKTISDLKSNCNNAELFDKQIEKLLSLKSQLDIEPTELIVKSADVIDHFNYDSFGLTKTKNEIIFETNGFKTIVKPWVERLYTILDMLCDVKKKGKNASEEDRKIYDVMFNPTIMFMLTPLFAFNEDKLTAELYSFMVKAYNEYTERKLGEDLKPETEVEDNEFENQVNMFEEAKKEEDAEDK